MTQRATCWSITINNPEPEETGLLLPAGWSLVGQFEEGEEGTRHFQGMLSTPQVRFSAVKAYFPRAHIEVCRNRKALAQYVSKEETRIDSFDGNTSKNIFQWQDLVASRWDWTNYKTRILLNESLGHEGVALRYVDEIASQLIEDGARGLEFISVNPMWRSAWKKFYTSIIKRYESLREAQISQRQEGNERRIESELQRLPQL